MNAVFLCDQGHEVHGIDISLAALGRARSLSAKRKLAHKLYLVRGDLGRGIPYPAAHFDAALDIFAMTFVPEPERRMLIGEVSRVLSSGACYLLEFKEHVRRQGRARLLKTSSEFEERGLRIISRGFFIEDWRRVDGGRHLAVRILCRKSASP